MPIVIPEHRYYKLTNFTIYKYNQTNLVVGKASYQLLV